MRIIWTQSAMNELKDIYTYYKEISNVRIARKIKWSIFKKPKILSAMPYIGAIEEVLQGLGQGHRYLIQGNYKIIFFVDKHKIYITDVFDTRQDPNKLLEKKISS